MKKMFSRKKPQTVRDTMRKEYRFDYSRAKPNRFREKMSEGAVAVVLEPVAPASRQDSTDQRIEPWAKRRRPAGLQQHEVN